MGTLITLGVAAAIYFTPLLVAEHRHHPRSAQVAVLNFFLGWTLVGWVVALAMACGPIAPEPDYSNLPPLRHSGRRPPYRGGRR